MSDGIRLLNHVDPIPDLDYPRPQMRRDSFLSLDGIWDFCDAEIRVPFCPESYASGFGILLEDDDIVFYHRTFSLPDGFHRGRVLLHFGAVDAVADVFVNGRRMGRHEGGYTHFEFDITAALEESGTNDLLVRVEDRLGDRVQPFGKQKRKRGGMWYTPVTGIWQSVWLESVPETYIRSLEIRTNAFPDETHEKAGAEIVARLSDGTERMERIDVENPERWTPETPKLYPFELSVGEDSVRSYFALREISVGKAGGFPRLFLNRKPYFFHGLLDQGYFQNGIYTPENAEEYQKDIKIIKYCGFNMLRKHIKIEADIFYALCDRMGVAVFQDFVENGGYSYVRDTVLPNVGIGLSRDDRKLNADPKVREAFRKCVKETVEQLKNFPSVMYWTVFNEGWGQFNGAEMYREVKALDPTRIVDTASGWYRTAESDVYSEHVYFHAVKPIKRKKTAGDASENVGKPWVLSEYGGYTWAESGHVWNERKQYGYKDFRTKEEYENRLYECMERDVVRNIPYGLSADVLTQLSDVEDEVNGLITYDREILKINAARFRALGEKIKNIYEEMDYE